MVFAAGQGGVIGRRQLLRGGVSAATVTRMVDRGDLWRLHPGVYAVGRPDVSPYGRCWAAILATRGIGERPNVRALTARSSAALGGLLPYPPTPEVVVLDRDLEIPDLVVRRTRALPPKDVVLDRRRLPRTTWARCVREIADVGTARELEDLLQSSERRRVLDLAGLRSLLDSARGHGGTARLQEASEPYLGLPDADYRSLLERLAHRLLVPAGVPEPEVNGPVLLPDGRTVLVDLLLRAQRIAIELDGRDTHERVRQFEEDRRRDRQLQRLGFVVPRFVWWEVKRRPRVVVGDVLALLQTR